MEEEEQDVSNPKTSTRPKASARKKVQKIEKVEEFDVETTQVKDEFEEIIKDHAGLELEAEISMCGIIGISYQDYKNFKELSKEKQELIAASYKIPAGVIDFNDYCLGSRGILNLFCVIDKDIQVLGLRNNQINDEVLIEVCRKLSKSKNLREIDVSINSDITDKGGAALLYLAGKIRSLKRIDLSQTSVSLDLAHQILTRVNRNNSL